jgi:hypothetical protein
VIETTTRKEVRAMAKQTQQDLAYPVPEGYEDASPAFARAFAHAKEHNNSDKAALQFAEKWAPDFEFEDEAGSEKE